MRANHQTTRDTQEPAPEVVAGQQIEKTETETNFAAARNAETFDPAAARPRFYLLSAQLLNEVM